MPLEDEELVELARSGRRSPANHVPWWRAWSRESAARVTPPPGCTPGPG